MLNDGDVVQIKDVQAITGRQVLNVFFYVIEVLTAGIELLDVLISFRDLIVDDMRLIQGDHIEHTELIGENLTNGIDIETLILGLNGQDVTGGPPLPDYVAGSYRLNVGDKTTRPGGKRIAGIGESRVISNTYNPVTPGNDTFVAGLSFAEAVVGVPDGAGIMVPIVVGRDALGALDLTRTSVILSATTQNNIKTQVSRRV